MLETNNNIHQDSPARNSFQASSSTIPDRQKSAATVGAHLRFWNQTLICLGSMFERMGHSRSSCCLRAELGLGHSAYTRSSASTCSGVYRTYLPVSMPPLSYPPPPSLLPLRIATAAAISARPLRQHHRKQKLLLASSRAPNSSSKRPKPARFQPKDTVSENK